MFLILYKVCVFEFRAIKEIKLSNFDQVKFDIFKNRYSVPNLHIDSIKGQLRLILRPNTNSQYLIRSFRGIIGFQKQIVTWLPSIRLPFAAVVVINVVVVLILLLATVKFEQQLKTALGISFQNLIEFRSFTRKHWIIGSSVHKMKVS